METTELDELCSALAGLTNSVASDDCAKAKAMDFNERIANLYVRTDKLARSVALGEDDTKLASDRAAMTPGLDLTSIHLAELLLELMELAGFMDINLGRAVSMRYPLRAIDSSVRLLK